MKAIILAAGENSRLGKICEARPKCLINIKDNTLLEIQINTLYTFGIDNISVIRRYEGEKINIPELKYKEAIRQCNKIALGELEMVYFDSETRIQEIGKRRTQE